MKKSREFKREKTNRETLLNDIGKHLIPQIALQLVRDEVISVEGKTNDEIATEVISHLKAMISKKSANFVIGVDHTTDLLRQARKFLRQKQAEQSALYYATFFEHRINWLIVQICNSKRIEDKAIKQILRDTNMKAKCTWVLSLLGHKPLSDKNLKAVLDIAELRNAFVHYKWPVEHDDTTDRIATNKQIQTKLERAEGVIRYLKRFEDYSVYRGHGNRTKKALKGQHKNTAGSS